MAIQVKNQSLITLEELYRRIPVWDPTIWDALQAKRYDEAMGNFYTLLRRYTKLTVLDVFWKNILEGDSQIRGVITQEEWDKEIVPRFAGIILKTCTEELLEKIYSSISLETLINFHYSIVSQIEGDTLEEKINFLNKEKSWLLEYFLGSPLNLLVNGLLVPTSEKIRSIPLSEISVRLENAPSSIRSLMFSISDGRAIYDIITDQDVSDQEVVDTSFVIGSIALGLLSPEEFERKLNELIALQGTDKKELVNLLREVFIVPIRNDIELLTQSVEPLVKEKETSIPIKAVEEKTEEKKIKINKVEFPSIAEEKSSQGVSNAPFILHKEKDLSAGADGKSASPFKKGSVFSFGFFKPRGAPIVEKKEVSVKIESLEKPAEKKFSPAPVPASIFEQIKDEMEVKKDSAPKTQTSIQAKTVHYSAFKTELPQEPPAQSGEPHVDGNKIFFKQ